jgi:indolepyruvate ferredoxin oxidoreductase
MISAFRIAKMRRFRGGALDIFGRSAERMMERRLIGEYETLIGEVVDKLTPQNYELAVDLASIPEYVRGYGHVKERHARDAKVREAALLAQFRAEQPIVPVQAPVAQAV